MHFLHRLLRTLGALLFVAFGTLTTCAAQGDWVQLSYPIEAQEVNAQLVNLAFTARAPPFATENLASTGDAFAQTSKLRPFGGAKARTVALTFDGGFIAGKGTDDVLLLENKYRGSNPPEHPSYPITAGPATEGRRGWMAVEEGQINPATGQVDRPGAFLSDEPITSVDQVRNELAVRDDWKANPTHVQQYEIVPGTQVQSSTVGPQTNPDGTFLPGGGSQTQILPQTGQYPSDVLVPVGPAGRIDE